MAGRNARRGGGDRILESRHLVGLFLGVVLLCGVFFTLGYVMGRTQYGGSVHAADPGLRPIPATAASAGEKQPPAPSRNTGEWDFYSNKNENHLVPAAKVSAPATHVANTPDKSNGSAAPPATIAAPTRSGSPKMLKGSIVLQVAAVTHASDALAMSEALQQKKFPSYVVAPAGDNFYRVQVGPYSDDRSAESARAALDRVGFKAIIKR